MGSLNRILLRRRVALTGALIAALSLAAGASQVSLSGTGVRSYAQANNYVASSADVSSLFWNPAGLAFMQTQQFSVSACWQNNVLSSRYLSNLDSLKRQHFTFGNIGVASASPEIGSAVAFQNPYSFFNQTRLRSSHYSGGSLIEESRQYAALGSLSYWSFGVAGQVARNFGIGASVSLVTGVEDVAVSYLRLTDGAVLDPLADSHTGSVQRRYLGYDVRFGMLYEIAEGARLGLRIDLPSVLKFKETSNDTFMLADSVGLSHRRGYLISSLRGAAGLELPLGAARLAMDVRVRAPYSGQPEGTAASYWKAGGGASLMIPIKPLHLALRGGYSYERFDPYAFLFKYQNSEALLSDESAGEDRQLITGGIEYVIDKKVALEAAYGYTFWKQDKNKKPADKRQEHRVIVGMSIFY